MSEEQFRVCCIHKDNENPSKSTVSMQKAHQSLEGEGFSVEWMKESYCFQFKKKEKNCVFLFDPFEGKAFLHIRNLGCRILGPMCILTSQELKLDIPRKSTPVYNLGMKDVVVCCTNLEKNKRNDIHEKVETMGGSASRDLSSCVSHLIAGEVGSKKYQVASSMGIPIYLPVWVERVWETNTTRHVHATSSHFQQYTCPIFMGLVVTVSGLDAEERNQVKKAVESEGGKYSGEMKVNECTHLIINKPKGAKYEFAKKWKIHIVKSDWLYDSIEKGYCLDENKFKLLDKEEPATNVKTSTPEKENGPGGRLSNIGDISCISNVSMIQMTHLNDTAMPSATTQKRNSLDEMEASVRSIDLTKSTSDLFLDGCKIYLSGFRGTALEKLRKVINAGGATRLNTLNENVTHVVIGERIEKDIELLKSGTFRPHVVTAVWMAECYRQGHTVGEGPYRSPELPSLEPDSPKIKQKKRASENTTLKDEEQKQAIPEPDDEFSDIMSQYLLQDDPGTSVKAAADEENKDGTVAQDNDLTQDPTSEEVSQQFDDGLIFKKKVFMFFGFEEDLEKDLGEFIAKQGGKVQKITSRIVPDYAVVPIDGFPVDRTVNEIVTSVWLQMCLEQEKLLDLKSNFLFSPMDIKIDESPLTGCVLSVSGFTGTERDCLMYVAEILGAQCQEHFVRKAVNQLKPSSHLVVKEAEGSKYQAAKKWNIPAVSSRWLFMCAKSGKREPEEKFSIELESESQDITTSVQPDHKSVTQDPAEKSVQSHHVIQNNAPCDNLKSTKNSVCDTEHKSDIRSGARRSSAAIKRLNDHDIDDDRPRKSARLSKENEQVDNDVEMTDDATEDIKITEKLNLEDDMETNDDSVLLDRCGNARKPSLGKDLQESQKENFVSTSTPKLVNHRVKELRADEVEITPKNSSRRESLNSSMSLSKLDFADAYSLLKTPEGQIPKRKLGRRKSSIPFEELFAESIRGAAKFTDEYKGADEVDGVASSSFLVKDPLAGVVIYVSKKLSDQQSSLHDMVRMLGGHHQLQYDQSCTHVIFQGRTNDNTKEFQVARDQNKLIVSPLWLQMCKERKARVDESLFPHDYHPNTALVKGPLDGVVVYVSKKLNDQQSSLHDMVHMLGGDYRFQYDESCTHFIFQGRTNDTTKEFRVAREQKKMIVCPLWLQMCKEQNARVDESLFPHSYNPNLALSVLTSKKPGTPGRGSATKGTPGRASRRSLRTSSSSKPEDVEDISNNATAKSPSPVPVSKAASNKDDKVEETKHEVETCEMPGTVDIREEFTKELENMMAVTKTKRSSRRKSKKLSASGQLNMSGEMSSNESANQSRPGSRASHWSVNDEQKDASKTNVPVPVKENSNSVPESSQVQVTWDDPTGRLEQQRLAHKLERACSPTQDVLMNNVGELMDAQFSDIEEDPAPVPQLPTAENHEVGKNNSSPEPPSVAFHKQTPKKASSPEPVILDDAEEEAANQNEGEAVTPPPVFILSGMSQEEKEDYGALVESLGGHMLDGQNFDPGCTHLVIGVPARNEKLLACVASGKWVLHKSYFEACRQEGKFVQEDFYEWGGDGTASLMEKMSSSSRKLCEAAHRWRLEINTYSQDSISGAFSNWKVVLCTDRRREDNFRRLLQAGGATVLNIKPPFNKHVPATHVFMELNKVGLAEDDLVQLIKSDVICVKPDFIAAHLTDNPPPSPDQFCPSEVKSIQQSLYGKRKLSSSDDSRKRPKR